MSVESHTERIGSHEYTIVVFNASTAIKLWTRLVKLVGPALAELGDSINLGEGVDLNQEEVSGALSSAVSQLVGVMDEENTLRLIKDLLSQTSAKVMREHGEVDIPLSEHSFFDRHFSGGKGLAEMSRVVMKVLEVNYSDFLSDLLNAANARAAVQLSEVKKEPGETPEAATG